MRGLSKEVLARDAAAGLYRAACKDERDLWTRQELQHASAATQSEARQAALPLLEVCARCPIVAECRAWAEVDDYTGIAGAAAWVNGVEKPAHWVRRQADPRLAS